MDEQSWINESLEAAARDLPRRKASKAPAVWPFGKRETLTPLEIDVAAKRAYLAHCTALEGELRAMVGANWTSHGEGPHFDRVFIKGAVEVLSDHKRRCGNWLQAIGLTAYYCERQGWVSREQRASLHRPVPVPDVVAEARKAEEAVRDEWEAEWDKTLDEVKDKARRAGEPTGAAFAHALAIWNRGRGRRYDDEALRRWKAALASYDPRAADKADEPREATK